jgi:hypothetical protein
MLPVAHLRHQIEGRSRLVIPSKRGEAPFFAMLVERLRSRPGVEAVRAHPATGTVLLHHARAIEGTADWARENGLFDYAGPDPAITTEPRRARRRRVALATDAPRLLPGLFAGLADYRALRGPHVGNAVENFWNAYQLTKFQKRRGWAAVYLSIGAVQLVGGRVLSARPLPCCFTA